MTGELRNYEAKGIVGICPHTDCQKKAQQIPLKFSPLLTVDGQTTVHSDLSATLCAKCKKPSYWKEKELLYPLRVHTAPAPNKDMPPNILRLYEEAASIAPYSSRSAAALLRVAIANLCIEINARGKSISDKIGDLILNGLPVQVLVSLDDVRMIGDNACEPGSIEFEDDEETAQILFITLNLIVEKVISIKKKTADDRDYLSINTIVDARKSEN